MLAPGLSLSKPLEAVFARSYKAAVMALPDHPPRPPRQSCLAAATLSTGRFTYTVRVINLSEEGACVETDAVLWAGEQVEIYRFGDQRRSALVRWTAGRRAGLQWSEEAFAAQQRPRGLFRSRILPEA